MSWEIWALPCTRATSTPFIVRAEPHWVHCPTVIFDSDLQGAAEADLPVLRYAPSIAGRFSAGRGDMLVGHPRAVARGEQKRNEQMSQVR